MRLRYKIGLISVATVGLLAGAVGAAPYLIDVEAYKPGMIEAVREATGRELVIDGPVRLRMFPVPGVGAGDVHFSNAIGAKGAQMVDVRWVAVRPSWLALLQGRVEVGMLTLYRPTLVLETDADGRPNWEFKPGAGTGQAPDAPSAGLHLAVGQLAIVRGTVSYTNPATGLALTAENVNASATVGSFDGPFTIAGSATVNGVPLTLDLKVGAPTEKGHDTSFALQVSSGKLDFTGQLSAINPDARVNGHLSVQTGLLTDFISAIVIATGGKTPAFDASAVGRFSFDGGIEIAPDRLAVSDFQMTMGVEAASGSLALDRKPATTLSGHVSLPKLDLDRWQSILGKPGMFSLPAVASPAKGPARNSIDFNVAVSVDVAQAAYRGGTIRDLSVELDVAKGVVAVPRFKAVLPGDMLVQASSAAAGGDFHLAGPRLRDTLTWLGVDTGAIPKDRLQTLKADGKVKSTAASLQVSDAKFDFDGTPGTGSGTLTFATPLTAAVTVAMDRFDLDAYMPKPPTTPVSSFGAPIAATAQKPAGPLPSFGLKAKVAKLVYRAETLNGVEGDATVQGNLLKVADLKVADLLGAKLQLRGSVNDFATKPLFDLTFDATVPDAERLLDYAGLPRFRNGKIGAATASGGVAGTLTAVKLRDVAVGFLGASGHASGSLSLADPMAFDFSSFSLQSPEAGRLASVATGRPMTGVGPISAAGSFKGTPERAAFNGDLEARGAKLIGTLDATLGARPKIVATLKVPGTLDIDQWLGVSALPAPASPSQTAAPAAPGLPPVPRVGAATTTPIDLSALRSFDAALSIFTSTTSIASLKLNYADFDATLSNGVLKMSRLTGQFYGGAVDFTGVVDASGPVLALDFKGSLQGIYLGEMLR
ncbi:MAG: AsmA family protein, partial [Reyranellales bacterium]